MIICCGEALIDMIPVTGVENAPAFQPHAGGAVFNTAIALGRLDVATGFVSGLSTDLFGEMLQSALHDSHVDTQFAIRSDKPTTLAFVKLSNGQASYTFYDENTAGRSLTPQMVPDTPPSADAFFFGGISLISEPCAEYYLALATRVAAHSVVAVDPNIRVGFIRDEAGYRARLAKLFEIADLIKVSDEDLNWLVPGDAVLRAKAQTLAPQKLVIVTRGGDGASAVLPDGSAVDVKARRVDVVDTVGAGDTFNAGVLAALSKQHMMNKHKIGTISQGAIESALEFGARVASVTVSRSGANPPWSSELN